MENCQAFQSTGINAPNSSTKWQTIPLLLQTPESFAGLSKRNVKPASATVASLLPSLYDSIGGIANPDQRESASKFLGQFEHQWNEKLELAVLQICKRPRSKTQQNQLGAPTIEQQRDESDKQWIARILAHIIPEGYLWHRTTLQEKYLFFQKFDRYL